MKVISINIFLLLAITGTPALLYPQSFTVDSAKKSIDFSGDFGDAEIHLSAVKKLPSFSGGKKAWQNFLRSNINIAVPFSNKAIPGTYKVMIRFFVGSDGKLRNIGADTNCGYGMETELIRCIKTSADWIPAETSSGKKVSFTMRTAVTFIVKQNDVSISFE
jgi:hypothetical protein